MEHLGFSGVLESFEAWLPTFLNPDKETFSPKNSIIFDIFDAEKSKVINLTGSDNISDDDFGNVIYYSVVRGEGMSIIASNITINITNLPSRYDLRQEGLVTPVKDQGYMGACWAFGATGALESAFLKATGIWLRHEKTKMEVFHLLILNLL